MPEIEMGAGQLAFWPRALIETAKTRGIGPRSSGKGLDNDVESGKKGA